MRGDLELRIVSGDHAGARVALENMGVITVGGSTDCDIVLRDVGQARATLEVLPAEWVCTPLGEAPVRAVFGRIVEVGQIFLTVDMAEAAWPETLSVEAPAAESPGSEATKCVRVRVLENFRLRVCSRTGKLALAVAIAACAAFGVFWTGWWQHSASDSAKELASGEAAITPASAPAAVSMVIEALGLADSVRVLVADNGTVTVEGVVDDDTQLESLVVALSGLGRRQPAIGVLAQSEFAARAAALSRDLPHGLEVTARRRGRLIVTGVAAEKDIAASEARLRQELPETARVDVEARTVADVVADFAAELQGRGLDGLQVTCDGAQMMIDGAVDAAQQRDLERALSDFNRRYGRFVPFVASLRNLPLSRAKLPEIMAVIGGGEPGYVMLEDGRKIMVGGQLGAYRLVAVQNKALVVADERGNTMEVPR